MSQSAQSIVTSHRAAAARAVDHFKKTRGWRLSLSESLELVACVLGQPNWQTLQALAKQGKGPRVATDAAVRPAPAEGDVPADPSIQIGKVTAATKEQFLSRDKCAEGADSVSFASLEISLDSIRKRVFDRLSAIEPAGSSKGTGAPVKALSRKAELASMPGIPVSLSMYYANRGLREDPLFPQENYDYLRKSSSLFEVMGAQSYWQWVVQGITESGAMLPWERDALPSVAAFQDSERTVAPAYPGWRLMDKAGAPVFPEVAAFDTEAAAWAHATEWLGKEIVRGIKDAVTSAPESTEQRALPHLSDDEGHLRAKKQVIQIRHGQNLKHLGSRRPPLSVLEDPAASAVVTLYEDPLFPRAAWGAEMRNERPSGNYWAWVVSQVDKIGAMLPWEREAGPDVANARGKGLRVVRKGLGWEVLNEKNERVIPFLYDREADAWRDAAVWPQES